MDNPEEKELYYIDSHAHLDMIKSMSAEVAVKEAGREKVRYIINVGSSLEGSRKSCEYAQKFENVFASVGIHPHDAVKFNQGILEEIEMLIQANGKVVAVGETGYDFFRNLSQRQEQEKSFISHIEIALKYKKPIIVHDREAHGQVMDTLKSYAKEKDFKVVIHCFSGDTNFALKCLELGFFISFTGVITFPNAKNLAQTVREVPLDKIFIETDSPFLAPQDKRGMENYPGFVKYVAYKIAEIKQIPVAEVANATSTNAEKFFNLDLYVPGQ